MRVLAIALALLSLAACKEDLAGKPAPVEMTVEAVGFYCQMDLFDHVGPKGQIHLDGMPAPVFFSQVRDAIAYLHMPEQNHAVRATYVQDMTGADWAEPGEWIAAEDAFYVLGSDKMGGMDSPEFVPFSEEDAARDFAALHGGEVRRFDQIEPEDTLFPTVAASPDNDDLAARLHSLRSEKGTN